MNFSFQAVVAEWQTRCLQAAVIFGRAGSSPANRTIFIHGREINRNSETMEYGSVEGVYHNGSGDFSVRTDIGMLEFTLIEFITDDFATFTKMVEKRLPHIIETHYVHCREDFSVILTNKGVPDGDWQDLLPLEYAGFERIIEPSEAVRIINGSYMVVAYYDASTRSGVSIMYNLLRDDFFAERRVRNFPNLVHDFDSKTVDELRTALSENLRFVLDDVRGQIK